jgi:hypothetical protein
MQIAHGRLYVNGAGEERAISVRTGVLETVAQQLLPVFNSGPIQLISHAPCSADVDSFGNLVVAENGVQVVAVKSGRFYGQNMTSGHVYRAMQAADCAGTFSRGQACAVDVAVDRSGNLIASFSASLGRKRTPAGINVAPARSGTYYGIRMKVGHTYRLVSGGGGQVAPDRAGNLLVAGDGANRVGVIVGTTGRFYGRAMKAGHLYDIAGTGQAGFSGDGGPAVKARLSGPQGVAVDSAGNVVIGDTGNSRVRVVAERTGRFYGLAMKAGHIYTVIGSGSPAGQAARAPVAAVAVAVDATGNLLTLSTTARTEFAGVDNALVQALATKSGRFYGQQMRAGHVHVVAGVASGAPGDGGPAIKAQFEDMGGVAADSAGNVLVTSDCRVRVVAAKSGPFYGQPMTAGDVYTIAGDGSEDFSGDGGPALKAGMCPGSVKIDGSGNVVFADDFGLRVRVVAEGTGPFYGQAMTAGDVYTIAGNGQDVPPLGDGGPAIDAEVNPFGVGFDQAGNLLIADVESGRIRVVATQTGEFYGQSMTAGDIYTVAGGDAQGSTGDDVPALQADIEEPIAVTTDSNGNIVFSEDFVDKLIRVVAVSTGTFYGQAMTAGDIYSIAGQGGEPDGGPAAMAGLRHPGGLTFDAAGNLVLVDAHSGHGRVRAIAASTGTFYGQAMTAGDIYTIAGGGNNGLGDGGPGTEAEVAPGDVAVAPDGDVVIADSGDGRVRLVVH